ncbi:MAG TPA: phosphotransferase [Stellaceae bacterium]|nr:phosphotransferase [Stellaceae bacterium]
MLIDRDTLSTLIPHDGAMCLLADVLAWDAATIRCRATSHRDPGNPLRSGDRLSALAGIEYAAQAMAAHAALVEGSGRRPRAGYLASLREHVCLIDRLDTLPGDLIIDADLVVGEGARVIYGFTIRHEGTLLCQGRAAVVVDEAAVV